MIWFILEIEGEKNLRKLSAKRKSICVIKGNLY